MLPLNPLWVWNFDLPDLSDSFYLQVDYLQQTNQDLEDRIGELEDGKTAAVGESQRMRSEVDRLHDELRDIDKLAHQLEQEKQVRN